jgi:hypothetical protein
MFRMQPRGSAFVAASLLPSGRLIPQAGADEVAQARSRLLAAIEATEGPSGRAKRSDAAA